MVTNGRRRRITVKNGAFSRSAASRSDADGDLDAVLAQVGQAPARPRAGSDPRSATTARRMPAGDHPARTGRCGRCELHGSSVQYSVAPRARRPASASATTSACGAAGRLVRRRGRRRRRRRRRPPPRPSGFGLVRPRPRSAAASARAMCIGVGGHRVAAATISPRRARPRTPPARTEPGRRCPRRRRRSGSAA